MLSVNGINIRQDLTGTAFGNLIVVGLSHRAGKENIWSCECSCGKPIRVAQTDLRGGRTSCGCGGTGKWYKEFGHGTRSEDLTGKVFDRLTVISYQGVRKNKQALWLCKCSCGNESLVETRGLRSGTSSCGCKGKEGGKPLPQNLGASNKVIAKYKYTAKQKGNSYNLPYDFALSLITSNCYYCGASPEKKIRGFMYSGIDRIDNTRGYEIDNVVPCCKTCNYAKNTMSLDRFKQWAYDLFDNMNAREIKHAR